MPALVIAAEAAASATGLLLFILSCKRRAVLAGVSSTAAISLTVLAISGREHPGRVDPAHP